MEFTIMLVVTAMTKTISDETKNRNIASLSLKYFLIIVPHSGAPQKEVYGAVVIVPQIFLVCKFLHLSSPKMIEDACDSMVSSPRAFSCGGFGPFARGRGAAGGRQAIRHGVCQERFHAHAKRPRQSIQRFA
jgi:hypothetical protein